MADLVFLRTFLAIYRSGSLTRAAELLHLTQPAVSQHLKALEAQVGRALFVRHSRGVRASPAGEELAREVGPHVDALESIGDAIREPGAAGTLRLGGPVDLLATRLVPALVPLLDQGLRLDVHPGLVGELMDRLTSGELDLVAASERLERVERPGIALELLFVERQVLVASPGFAARLPELPAERRRALGQGPIVAFVSEMPAIRAHLRALEIEAPTRPALVIPDARAIAAAVVAGAGIALLPLHLVADLLARGELIELSIGSAQGAESTIYLALREGMQRSPRLALVCERLRAAAASWSGRAAQNGL